MTNPIIFTEINIFKESRDAIKLDSLQCINYIYCIYICMEIAVIKVNEVPTKDPSYMNYGEVNEPGIIVYLVK